MRLTIYGDFNCPFSALANSRATALEQAGAVTVEWRAVQHEPTIPYEGQPVIGDLADELDEEIARIRGLLRPGEVFTVNRPPARANTELPTLAYAAAPAADASGVRGRLFDAYWVHGRNIGVPDELVDAGIAPASGPVEAAERWQAQWSAFDPPMVPIMQLGDGSVSMGLDVLDRLRDEAALRGSPPSAAST